MILEAEINLEREQSTNKQEILLFEFLRSQLRECSAKLAEYRINREVVLSKYNTQLLDSVLHNSPQKTANLIKLANLDLVGLLNDVLILNHALYLMPERLIKNVVQLRRAQLKKRFFLLRFIASNLAWLENTQQKHSLLFYPTFLECVEVAKKTMRPLNKK